MSFKEKILCVLFSLLMTLAIIVIIIFLQKHGYLDWYIDFISWLYQIL
ncbi:MAG: hypothetical protein KHY19_02555 [Coprobacillus cateniformis]|nr:hypothetical protein [Coprobacillus cateniformis]